LSSEYHKFYSLESVFVVNSSGFTTHRDELVIDYDQEQLKSKIEELANLQVSDQEIENKFGLHDNRDWSLHQTRRSLSLNKLWLSDFRLCLYRPFDARHIFYNSSCIDFPRNNMIHLLEPNLGLATSKVRTTLDFDAVLATEYIVETKTVESTRRSYVFPLYTYPDTTNQQSSLFVERTPNFSLDFVSAIREKLGYTPTPEAIFYYIYAILHSPIYRQRYAEFLKIDFPHVPLTSNDQLFKDLGAKGQILVDLHLMKSKKLNKLITKMNGTGDNAITEVTYKFTEQRVYLNKDRYFEGIAPEVWEFKIGGYQVLDKWLKDRKKAKRTLSFDDVLHYQKVVVALKETMQLMEEIDKLIPGFPIE